MLNGGIVSIDSLKQQKVALSIIRTAVPPSGLAVLFSKLGYR